MTQIIALYCDKKLEKRLQQHNQLTTNSQLSLIRALTVIFPFNKIVKNPIPLTDLPRIVISGMILILSFLHIFAHSGQLKNKAFSSTFRRQRKTGR